MIASSSSSTISNQHQTIRKKVASAYGKAVMRKTRTRAKSATKSSSCCCKTTPKGVVAKLAGYSDEELSSLPPEAVVNSFGCGNPLAFAMVQAGEVVLDLGCGAGIDLLLAARKVGKSGKVIGVDMTDEMLAKARENITASKLHNVIVKKGIIEDLPIESSSIDWVISNCVINLSPNKERVFSEIARVLKPGGKILVSDIVAEYLPPEIVSHPELYSSCLAGAISEKAYVAGLHAAGFETVEIRGRLFYDASQLKAFIVSELHDESATQLKKSCVGCKSPTSRDKLAKLWCKELEGKVWSIKIFAIKSP